MDPTVAIVTKAKGLFFKPLYESFAEAQPDGWKTLLVWPAGLETEHPVIAVSPTGVNFEIGEARSAVFQIAGRRSFLPSIEAWRILSSKNVRALIIHEFSPYTVQALLQAKLKGIPVLLSTEIGRRNGHFFSSSVRLWHIFWGKFVDGIIACSPSAHEPLSGRKIPSVSAYHAMDSRSYQPTNQPDRHDGKVIFAYLGQLIHRKGLDLFLAAAARFRNSGQNNFLLRFIGGGDETTLRNQIASHGLKNYVELTGFLSGDSIREALETADVFVLPTREDTYAAVVHEAACLRMPLLISKYAGASESLVKVGVNGYVFDPQDCEAFAGYMERFMDPFLRNSMKTASREIAEAYSSHRRGASIWHWMEQHGFV